MINCYLFCEELLGPVERVGLLDRFQHNPMLRIVSKRSDNNPLPDTNAHLRTVQFEDMYFHILGIKWSLNNSIYSRL